MKTSSDVLYSKPDQTQNQRPKTGYAFLGIVLGVVQRYSRKLVEELEAPHSHGGRPGYPAMAMLSAVVLQHVLSIRYANRFLDELDNNGYWLDLCGLERAPTETAYSRFRKRLTAHQDQLDQLSATIFSEIDVDIRWLRWHGVIPSDAPDLGYYLAIDSTDIDAYGNGNRDRPRDPDATWGHRTKKSRNAGTKKDEPFYGYKNHEIGDAYYGLPIGGITLPANEGDGPQLPVVFEKVKQQNRWVKPEYLLADKAYAGRDRLQFVVDQGITPVVPIPKPRKNSDGKRLYDGLYDQDGRPVCLGGESMEYVESDPEFGHRFRCPMGGCRLKSKVQWTTHCDTEVWEKPEGKLLRTIGLLPRFTDDWKRIYRMRMSIERYFRSAKHSRLLDRHQFLGIAKVKLNISLARLSYLATALAHLAADDYAAMRQMNIRLLNVPEARNYPWLAQPLVRKMAA